MTACVCAHAEDEHQKGHCLQCGCNAYRPVDVTEAVMSDAKIRMAATNAVVHHLSMFPDSMAAEDLWENNPELTEIEAEAAGELADLMARSISAGIGAMP